MKCSTCGLNEVVEEGDQCQVCLLEERVEELERLVHKLKECFTWLR